MRFLLLLTAGLWLSLLLPGTPVSATPPAEAANDSASLDFPNSVTFQAELSAEAPIRSVVLEYGTEQLTCGEVIAKARPEFTPAGTVDVSWTWDMRRSGSLPPGTTIWWRWRAVDEAGRETVSPEQTVTWLDAVHAWQTLAEGDLRLHWYRGDQAFARDLLDAASGGLARLERDAGLVPDQPIDLYIYANTSDMREAILYEPGWTGGLAFPEHNIVILGISETDLDWGRSAEVHELTHVLVGHFTFSCLGGVPTWLNEGLAVYSEGALDPGSQAQLDQAIRTDALLTIRSLSVGFSEVPDKAYLSYSQSYSVVKFLVETHGQDRMTTLLTHLRDGMPIDEALVQVYGFDVDGLEDEWRQAVGAAPRAVSPDGLATSQPAPTQVPTIVPVSGGQLLITPTPFRVPTSSSDPGEAATEPAGPPLGLTLALLGSCCLLLLVGGVLAIGVFAFAQNRKGGRHAG